MTREESKRIEVKMRTLSKKELIHLIESNFTATMDSFLKNREFQRKREEEGPMAGCWDCKTIAHKLGIE